MHCTAGLDGGRTGTGSYADGYTGPRTRSLKLFKRTLSCQWRVVPPGRGLSRVRLHCPSSSSSRPPCLLFLGLSLGIFWATTVRGCLAKSPDALQASRQLQQQGNELKREGESEGCQLTPVHVGTEALCEHSSFSRPSPSARRYAEGSLRSKEGRLVHPEVSRDSWLALSNTCPKVVQV